MKKTVLAMAAGLMFAGAAAAQDISVSGLHVDADLAGTATGVRVQASESYLDNALDANFRFDYYTLGDANFLVTEVALGHTYPLAEGFNLFGAVMGGINNNDISDEHYAGAVARGTYSVTPQASAGVEVGYRNYDAGGETRVGVFGSYAVSGKVNVLAGAASEADYTEVNLGVSMNY